MGRTEYLQVGERLSVEHQMVQLVAARRCVVVELSGQSEVVQLEFVKIDQQAAERR